MKDLRSIIYDMIKEEFIEDEENTNTLDDLYNYHCHINNLASNFFNLSLRRTSFGPNSSLITAFS